VLPDTNCVAASRGGFGGVSSSVRGSVSPAITSGPTLGVVSDHTVKLLRNMPAHANRPKVLTFMTLPFNGARRIELSVAWMNTLAARLGSLAGPSFLSYARGPQGRKLRGPPKTLGTTEKSSSCACRGLGGGSDWPHTSVRVAAGRIDVTFQQRRKPFRSA